VSETARAGGVCRLSLSGRWLATGPNGGYHDCRAAHVVSVPEGFQRTDLETYADERLAAAGFAGDGPALLTGVDAARARCARSGSVTVLATAGLSNPARLPVEPSGPGGSPDAGPGPTGTVNLLVATARALSDGTLATLLGTAVEAKTATLQATTGFSGTTSDAVAVGSDAAGDPAAFAGSATDLGAATRICVRDALLAGLDAGADPPATVADAEHGVVTGGTADVFRP
jgi:adenosylcobinamide hydrolase